MYYYLIIALQGYCIYHAYKNRNQYYWFFIIFFIPLIGCLIYLFTQVINKRDVAVITEEISTIINPTKKIKDLEHQLQFSNTFQNKVLLADAYFENNDYQNAIIHYKEALKGNFKNDPHTINKLIKCHYKLGNFEEIIELATKINLDTEFKESIFFYATALDELENYNEAEIQFKKIDKRYSNYEERIEFSKFLLRREKKIEAIEILEDILSEINSMQKKSKKTYQYIYITAKKIMSEIN